MDWIRCTTEQMVWRLRNGNTANLPMDQVADRLEAHQKEHCNRLDEVRKMQADYAAILARAEAAEKERDKADATWVLALKEIAALKTERDHFAERSKMVEAEKTRLREALKQMCRNALDLGYCDMADCCNCKTTAALNGGGDE